MQEQCFVLLSFLCLRASFHLSPPTPTCSSIRHRASTTAVCSISSDGIAQNAARMRAAPAPSIASSPATFPASASGRRTSSCGWRRNARTARCQETCGWVGVGCVSMCALARRTSAPPHPAAPIQLQCTAPSPYPPPKKPIKQAHPQLPVQRHQPRLHQLRRQRQPPVLALRRALDVSDGVGPRDGGVRTARRGLVAVFLLAVRILQIAAAAAATATTTADDHAAATATAVVCCASHPAVAIRRRRPLVHQPQHRLQPRAHGGRPHQREREAAVRPGRPAGARDAGDDGHLKEPRDGRLDRYCQQLWVGEEAAAQLLRRDGGKCVLPHLELGL
jgi:hypothetical protein